MTPEALACLKGIKLDGMAYFPDEDTLKGCNYSAPPPRLLPPGGVAAMLESSHITHMLRILRFSRLAREQNSRGAE